MLLNKFFNFVDDTFCASVLCQLPDMFTERLKTLRIGHQFLNRIGQAGAGLFIGKQNGSLSIDYGQRIFRLMIFRHVGRRDENGRFLEQTQLGYRTGAGP